MNTHDVMILANLVSGTLFSLTVGFAVAWVRARERAVRAELSHPRLPREADERLARLEHVTEAIAVEVERISEGQRYLTKVLAPPAVRLPSPERVVTPH